MSKTMIDILGRETFVESIFSMMVKASEKQKPISFAIDGPWGVGKSFVLDMLEEKLRIWQNEKTSYDSFLVIRYNSWEYDYYQEPIIAIIAAIQDALIDNTVESKILKAKELGLSIAYEGLKKLASQVTKNKLGVDLTELIDGATNEDTFDNYSGLKQTIMAVRNNLSKIAERVTVVFLIDELDRCMPEYVIKIFNRCNHLFSGLINVQIVYSLNSKQIQHSIKMIFGNEVDTEKYIKKFIDNKFILDSGNIDELLIQKYGDYFNLFDESKEHDLMKPIVDFVNSLNLNMRTIDKVMEKVQLSHYMAVSDGNAGLLLFEVVTAFLIEVFGNNVRKYIMFSYTNRNCILQIVDNGKYTITNELLDTWSYFAINQYTIYDGNGWRVQDNPFGLLFACIAEVFGIDNIRLMRNEKLKMDELLGDCKEFLDVYTRSE